MITGAYATLTVIGEPTCRVTFLLRLAAWRLRRIYPRVEGLRPDWN